MPLHAPADVDSMVQAMRMAQGIPCLNGEVHKRHCECMRDVNPAILPADLFAWLFLANLIVHLRLGFSSWLGTANVCGGVNEEHNTEQLNEPSQI